jgi:hypothetical protein
MTRAESKKNLWQAESVVETLGDFGTTYDVLSVSHWPPERVAQILIPLSVNMVGKRLIDLGDRKLNVAGWHVWSVEVATAPWPKKVYFPCVAWPRNSTAHCSLGWVVETAGGDWSPSIQQCPSAWACQFTIGALSVGPPTP